MDLNIPNFGYVRLVSSAVGSDCIIVLLLIVFALPLRFAKRRVVQYGRSCVWVVKIASTVLDYILR